MTATIGYATLQIIPSAKGMLGNLSGELGGELDKAGDAAGASSSASFSSKFGAGMGAAGKLAGVGLAAGIGVGAGLVKIAGSFDEAADTIRTKTGATGAVLDGLNQSFKNVVTSVPADFEDASAAISGLNQSLGLSGKPLEDLSAQVLNLSHVTGTDLNANVEAAGALFNSWGTSASEQGPKLDELFRISQLTGVSVADLSKGMTEGGVQFREAGLSFEESGALLGTLGKNGLGAADVLPALSKAMAQAAKDGRPAADVFKETFDAIKNAPDGASAAAIAMETFGAKAGPKFAALIKEGKLSYEDMAASIADGGDTINQAAADTADWQEKLKLLMNKGMVALAPIAARVFDAVSVAIAKVGPPLAIVFDVFRNVITWLNDHRPVLIGVAAAIGVVLVSALIGWATAAWAAVAAQIALLAPLIAVALAVGVLVAGFIWAYQNVGFFRTAIDALVTAFQATWSFITDKLVPVLLQIIDVALLPLMIQFNVIKALIMDVLIPAFQAVWGFVANTLIPIIIAIASTFIDIGQTVTRIVGEIVDVVLSIGGKIAGFVAAMWDGIKTGITVAKDWVGARIGDIVGFVTGIGGRIGSAISTMWDGLKTGITTAKDWVASRITEIVGFVTGIGGRIGDAVSNMWDGIKTGITTAKNWVGDRIDDIVGFATALPGRMSGSFVGMWDGIKSAFRSALNWVISHWNNLSFTIPSVSAFGVTLGGGSVGTPNIPLLHSGGIVPGAAGSDVLTMLQAGEYVIDRQSVNALMSQQRPAMPDRVTLIIEGEPFTARIQKRDRQLVGSLAAGRFTE